MIIDFFFFWEDNWCGKDFLEVSWYLFEVIKSKLVLLSSLILMYLYWIYYVPNLLIILHILMHFLGGLHVALVSVLEP